ncbi:MAG TPA: polyprenyl synthetase family protein [Porphyromonadaceae bacterium]|nr:polyprenyl synthetase family protein [Porphyromonadaceae bacterium]
MEKIETIQERLSPELAEMNAIMRATLSTPNEMMNSVVETYLQVKGKQIRPILVILSAKMFGEVNDKVLHAGAALEMLHNASLIHDDVVDETELRRGLPTINSQWGNQIAVLVGDFFVSNALAAGIRTGHIEIISAISDLGKELSLGEVDQICNARDHVLSEEKYFDMIGKKTASLFLNCIRMGAEAVDAPAEAYAPLVEYARLLGLCFQIKDDVFDYFDSKQIGKPTGNDLREGKVTLPLLHALRVAPAEESGRMRTLLEGGTPDEAAIAALLEFAKRHGGIDYAFARMRELQQQADEIILKYPESPWRQSLRDIFDYIISRDK